MEEIPWEKDVQAIEARIPTAPAQPIVFTGSSSIALWRTLGRDFAEYPVFNAGFGGATLRQVLDRAPRIVLPLAPKQIVLFAGENDIALGRSCEEAMHDFGQFCEMTKPAPLIIFSVKPSPARVEYRHALEELNTGFRTASNYDVRLTYLDIWTPMLNDTGEPRTEYWMRDGIHVNRAGYSLWTHLLRPYLI